MPTILKNHHALQITLQNLIISEEFHLLGCDAVWLVKTDVHITSRNTSSQHVLIAC
jgi:hypothetical protein